MAGRTVGIGLVWWQEQLLVGVRPTGVAEAGFFEFPGGKVEPNESIRETVRRECLEETGLTVQVMGLRSQQWREFSRGVIELHFYDCIPQTRLARPNEAGVVDRSGLGEVEARIPVGVVPDIPMPSDRLMPFPPFAWRHWQEVLQLRFPEPNAAVLKTLPLHPYPLHFNLVE